jgi:hypothetical protein
MSDGADHKRRDAHYARLQGSSETPNRRRLRVDCRQLSCWIKAAVAERLALFSKKAKRPVYEVVGQALTEFMDREDERKKEGWS